MIIVFGSIYMDIVMPVAAYPARHAINAAGPVLVTPGGKGANQAVAAARTGAKVFMTGMVGDDTFGHQVCTVMKSSGVMTSGVGRSEYESTGLVVVLTEPDGENTQIASSGANGAIRHEQLSDEAFKAGSMLVSGLSLAREQVRELLTRAQGRGMRIVLNLSPIKPGMAEFAALGDILVINKDEALALGAELGLDQPAMREQGGLAVCLSRRFQKDVIVTLGAEGVEAGFADGECAYFPPFPVEKIVDTNGAGDCFLGFFCGFIDQGMERRAAIARAVVASALSCTKPGAMGSYPYIDDVTAAYEKALK